MKHEWMWESEIHIFRLELLVCNSKGILFGEMEMKDNKIIRKRQIRKLNQL